MNPVPVALPQNYFTEWASLESKPVDNPFSDSKANSRVTASGFTETTVTPRSMLKEAEDELKEVLSNSIKMSEEIQRKRVPWYKSSERKRDLDNLQRFDREVSSKLHQMATEALEKTQIDKESEVRSYTDGLYKAGGLESDEEDRCWEPELREKYVTIEDFKRFTESISPHDSASVTGQQLTSLQTKGKKTLSQIVEDRQSLSEEVEQTVVGGYDLTAQEKLREIDTYTRLKPVRGLPKMFTSNRLNFLVHIHSALFQVLSDGDKYPSEGSFEVLMDRRTSWPNDPSTDLLEQVLDCTIDPKDGVVISNPFSLPLLEVSMKLNSTIVYMVLDQLHREFELEWFNIMKFVTMPKFQSKYERLKHEGSKRHRRVSRDSDPDLIPRKHSSSSGRTASTRRSSSSEARSILSAFLP